MKKKLPVILHSLFFIFCFTLAVLILHHLISSRYLKIEYTPSSSEESSQNLDNPYRGFYQMGGYILSEKSICWLVLDSRLYVGRGCHFFTA